MIFFAKYSLQIANSIFVVFLCICTLLHVFNMAFPGYLFFLLFLLIGLVSGMHIMRYSILILSRHRKSGKN